MMAFCQYCGKQIPDDANACPYCGKLLKEQQAPQQAAPEQAAPQQNYQQAAPQQAAPQQNYQQAAPQQAAPQQNYQQAPPAQPVYMTPEMDVQQSRGIAWLSYVGLLFLIPMFVKRFSDYTRFHVKQGATLFATELAYWITTAIIKAIINLIFPGNYYFYYYVHSDVYNVFSWLFGLAGIFFTVLAIIGIVNAATGKKKELFLIGKIPWIATLLDKTVYKQ